MSNIIWSLNQSAFILVLSREFEACLEPTHVSSLTTPYPGNSAQTELPVRT
jgi:hypothetical protein